MEGGSAAADEGDPEDGQRGGEQRERIGQIAEQPVGEQGDHRHEGEKGGRARGGELLDGRLVKKSIIGVVIGFQCVRFVLGHNVHP